MPGTIRRIGICLCVLLLAAVTGCGGPGEEAAVDSGPETAAVVEENSARPQGLEVPEGALPYRDGYIICESGASQYVRVVEKPGDSGRLYQVRQFSSPELTLDDLGLYGDLLFVKSDSSSSFAVVDLTAGTVEWSGGSDFCAYLEDAVCVYRLQWSADGDAGMELELWPQGVAADALELLIPARQLDPVIFPFSVEFEHEPEADRFTVVDFAKRYHFALSTGVLTGVENTLPFPPAGVACMSDDGRWTASNHSYGLEVYTYLSDHQNGVSRGYRDGQEFGNYYNTSLAGGALVLTNGGDSEFYDLETGERLSLSFPQLSEWEVVVGVAWSPAEECWVRGISPVVYARDVPLEQRVVTLQCLDQDGNLLRTLPTATSLYYERSGRARRVGLSVWNGKAVMQAYDSETGSALDTVLIDLQTGEEARLPGDMFCVAGELLFTLSAVSGGDDQPGTLQVDAYQNSGMAGSWQAEPQQQVGWMHYNPYEGVLNLYADAFGEAVEGEVAHRIEYRPPAGE